MKVRILTAVLVSTFLLVLCAEATVVRKCQGKQVLYMTVNRKLLLYIFF